MRKKNKRGRHEKKRKKRISKSKLFIVALVVLFVGIVVVKATEFTINGAVKVKENIVVTEILILQLQWYFFAYVYYLM